MTRLRRLAVESSLPLVLGIVAALVWANLDPAGYRSLVDGLLVEGAPLHGRELSLRFLVNEVFMVLFFGLAAKEVVVGLLPGGSLHPPRRAANPVLASVGGVVGPALVYLGLVHGLFRDAPQHAILMQAWAVPTATDIALVWLLGRFVFGAAHPAVKFLLVLAIVDDALGLAIIALFYPEAGHVPSIWSLLSVLLGIGAAALLRVMQVRSWLPYAGLGGGLVWLGLIATPVHPSLALIPIVPFMVRSNGAQAPSETLDRFEQRLSPVVEVGLFLFGLVNAGVELEHVGFLTWVVLSSLVVGKTLGVASFALGAERLLGFPLPLGMTRLHLGASALLASVGLTVSLFVAGEALPDAGPYQPAAKLGALLSLGIVAIAPLLRTAISRRQPPFADGADR